MGHGLQRRTRPVPQRACALRAANLVRRQAEIVDAEQADIDRTLTEPLHRIANRQTACLAHDTSSFSHWLDHAGLIIGEHQAQNRCAQFGVIPIRKLILQLVQVQRPVGPHIGGPHLHPRMGGSLGDGLMLNR